MNTKIIDKRAEKNIVTFASLQIGSFFQDDNNGTERYEDTVCMKISDSKSIRFFSNGSITEEGWECIEYFRVIPLKATITVERGE